MYAAVNGLFPYVARSGFLSSKMQKNGGGRFFAAYKAKIQQIIKMLLPAVRICAIIINKFYKYRATVFRTTANVECVLLRPFIFDGIQRFESQGPRFNVSRFTAVWILEPVPMSRHGTYTVLVGSFLFVWRCAAWQSGKR